MIHSIPTQREPCQTVSRAPHPRLRPYVVGYSGFCSDPGSPLAHRLFPLSLTTVIIDFADTSIVTGSRDVATVEPTPWGRGIAIALTPAGVRSVLGLPAAELVGATIPLTDLPGSPLAGLAEPRRRNSRPSWTASPSRSRSSPTGRPSRASTRCGRRSSCARSTRPAAVEPAADTIGVHQRTRTGQRRRGDSEPSLWMSHHPLPQSVI